MERLDGALAALSAAIGDRHLATASDLLAAGFRAEPAFHAQIAERAGLTIGAVVYSPVFSTSRGGAGIYVSDLFVSPQARGSGLGRRLLAAALADGEARWQARFIRLAVHHDNVAAAAFYARLGFSDASGERCLVLDGASVANLKG